MDFTREIYWNVGHGLTTLPVTCYPPDRFSDRGRKNGGHRTELSSLLLVANWAGGCKGTGRELNRTIPALSTQGTLVVSSAPGHAVHLFDSVHETKAHIDHQHELFLR